MLIFYDQLRNWCWSHLMSSDVPAWAAIMTAVLPSLSWWLMSINGHVWSKATMSTKPLDTASISPFWGEEDINKKAYYRCWGYLSSLIDLKKKKKKSLCHSTCVEKMRSDIYLTLPLMSSSMTSSFVTPLSMMLRRDAVSFLEQASYNVLAGSVDFPSLS